MPFPMRSFLTKSAWAPRAAPPLPGRPLDVLLGIARLGSEAELVTAGFHALHVLHEVTLAFLVAASWQCTKGYAFLPATLILEHPSWVQECGVLKTFYFGGYPKRKPTGGGCCVYFPPPHTVLSQSLRRMVNHKALKWVWVQTSHQELDSRF